MFLFRGLVLLGRDSRSLYTRPTRRSRPFRPELTLKEKLWACKLPEQLGNLVLETPSMEFTPVDTATAFHRLGKFRTPPLATNFPVVSKLYKLGQYQDFSARDLCNICYGVGIGKLDTCVPHFVLEQLKTENFKKMRDFTPTDCTQLLIGLSSLGCAEKDIIGQVETLFFKPNSTRVQYFQSKELSQVAFSLAKLSLSSSLSSSLLVFDLIGREVKRRNPKSFSANDIGHLFYALHLSQPSSLFAFEEIYEMLSKEVYNNRELKDSASEETLCLLLEGACEKQFPNKHLLFRYVAKHLVEFRNLSKKEFTPQLLERIDAAFEKVEKRMRNPAMDTVHKMISLEIDRRANDAIARARKGLPSSSRIMYKRKNPPSLAVSES